LNPRDDQYGTAVDRLNDLLPQTGTELDTLVLIGLLLVYLGVCVLAARGGLR
jgi:uncharacterized surface anchored protein